MKKKTLFIAVLALACACISCNKEKELAQEPAEYLLTAGTESTGDDTKTYIATGNWGKEIRWNENDQIAVFSEHSNTYTYTLKEGAKTTSGVFSTSTKPDFKSDSKYAAYFPASVVKDDNGRTFNWPSEQTRVLYSPEIVALPLLAEGNIEDGAPSNATFNCLGGILDILLKVPEDGVGGYIRKVVITTDQKISGKFTLKTVTEQVRDSEGHLTSETVEKKYAVIANDGSNSITYTLQGNDGMGMYVSEGDKLQHHLIIAMPVSPADGYTNFQVDFYDQHGTRISGAKSKNPLVIERGMVTNANIPFSHKYAPGLTMNSPVGTIGTLYGVEAIVIEIGGYKRALALHNVGYTNENPAGTVFNMTDGFNSSSAGLTNGWRLPYEEEWLAMNQGNQDIDLDNDPTYDYVLDYDGNKVLIPHPAVKDINYTYYACQNNAAGEVAIYCYSSTSRIHWLSSSSSYTGNAYVRAIRELPFYPELDPERQLTKDDPVGSIGMIGTRQAVVMKLRGYKVAVATVDVGGSVPEEPGDKFSFTYSATGWNFDQLNLTNGWRLPTSQEITELSTGFKIHDDDVWRWPLSDASTLVIPNGMYYVSGESNYYCSGFYGTWFLAQDGSIDNACARPFHNLEEITKDSPDGTVGVVDGRECVVVSDDDGKKFLITVNNPGPCEGGFGADGSDDPNDFNCYKHGTYETREDAKSDTDNGYYGKGWKIATKNELESVVYYNKNYTKTWNDSENGIEVKIQSYTWYMYAGGYIVPNTGSPTSPAVDTERCYYLVQDEDGSFEYLYAELYHGDPYILSQPFTEETKKYKYNFCLTHAMPN